MVSHTAGRDERGAVSIFLVVFFALLIGVITISFIGIVIRDATQSTNNDLSRSAYDSAQAGIEDAKRAIALYTTACTQGTSGCDGANAARFSDTDCQAFFGYADDLDLRKEGNEVQVQSSTDAAFNQAYTCVTVEMNTPDYLNSKSQYQSDIIPLKSTGAFDGVSLDWFTHTDASAPDTATFTPRDSCTVTAGGSSCSLPKQSDWDQNAGAPYTPSLLRVQLISYDDGSITDTALQNSSRTLFLYPSASGASTVSFDADSQPPSADATPPIIPVKCGGSGQYACSVNVSLGANAGRTSLLRVTPVYKQTTFRVSLTGAGNPLFAGVQPIVDSTGRAGDLFRRVQARVRLQNDVLFPEYAVDVTNSLCKDFSIGSDPADFVNRCQ